MGPRGRRADDLEDLDTTEKQRVGDQRAVAAPGHGLGAHDGHRVAGGQLQQDLDPGAEGIARHVVGVATEAQVPPAGVDRIRPRLAESTQLGKVRVLDAVGWELRRQRGPREVCKPPRPGRRPHVDKPVHPVCPQQLDQLREGPGRMADGVDGQGFLVIPRGNDYPYLLLGGGARSEPLYEVVQLRLWREGETGRFAFSGHTRQAKPNLGEAKRER